MCWIAGRLPRASPDPLSALSALYQSHLSIGCLVGSMGGIGREEDGVMASIPDSHPSLPSFPAMRLGVGYGPLRGHSSCHTALSL